MQGVAEEPLKGRLGASGVKGGLTEKVLPQPVSEDMEFRATAERSAGVCRPDGGRRRRS